MVDSYESLLDKVMKQDELEEFIMATYGKVINLFLMDGDSN